MSYSAKSQEPASRQNANSFTPVSGGLLQRKCACGGASGLSGSCSECETEKMLGRSLQTKLRINEPGDVYEQEADRIADQVTAKGRTMPSGNVAELVASGNAEIAIQQMSELMAVKGVDVVGALPPEVDLISQISAAIGAASKDQGAAKALMDFLLNAETQKVIKASGMVPG